MLLYPITGPYVFLSQSIFLCTWVLRLDSTSTPNTFFIWGDPKSSFPPFCHLPSFKIINVNQIQMSVLGFHLKRLIIQEGTNRVFFLSLFQRKKKKLNFTFCVWLKVWWRVFQFEVFFFEVFFELGNLFNVKNILILKT